MKKIRSKFSQTDVWRDRLMVATCTAAMIGAISIMQPSAAKAESLAQALTSAYQGNPALRAERARQRATDELVPQALSGWRPTVSAVGDVVGRHTKSQSVDANRFIEDRGSPGFSIQLNQPIFRGFRTINETKRAESSVEAGRQRLLVVEQQVLLDAMSAFANVVRDREIVSLRRKNVTFLQEQLRAANARFEVGEITKTDVAQSRARLSRSKSDLAREISNLRASSANYARFIGHQPRKLTGLKTLRKLPKTLRQAIAIAERANPNVLNALRIEDASIHNIEAVKGNLLPTVSLRAQFDYTDNPGGTTNSTRNATILGQVSVPLYQAGRVYSQVREAKQISSQRRLEALDVGRQVREAAVSSWHALIAARQAIKSLADEVKANRFALDGVRQEALVGSRTTLDVLDAEQELVDSLIFLSGAKRTARVAAYQVLGSIGKLTAHDLRLRVSIYDPEQHYSVTRDKLFGTDTETVE